ncbi:MAG: hypothetical protein ACKVVP_01680 [Chloroflexota bacterium]
MQYERLIIDAWKLTRSHRFLWLLGLFAGGASSFNLSSGANARFDQSAFDDFPSFSEIRPKLDELSATALRWMSDHLPLIIAAVMGLMLFTLFLLAISLVCQGALAWGTLRLANGGTASLGQAWQAGFTLVWRFMRLTLVIGLMAIVLALLIGGVVALAAVLFANGNPFAPAVVGVLGLPLGLLALVLGVLASVVIPFAQRAMVDRDCGTRAALHAGWQLFRAQPGRSLAIWFINLVLGVAFSMVIGIGLIILLIVLAIPGGVLWWSLGFGGVTGTYIALAVTLVIGMLIAVAGFSNAYFWSYWTVAYLRIGGVLAPSAPASAIEA